MHRPMMLRATVTLAAFFVANRALAQDPPPSASPKNEPAVSTDAGAPTGRNSELEVRPTTPSKDRFRPVALTLNPLSLLFLQRIGLNVEWLPTTHHAIAFNPSFQFGDNSVEQVARHRVFSGELGYHYYLGSKGADGIWFGPSVLAHREEAEGAASAPLNRSGTVHALGGAFDVGGQVIVDGGFTIGAGVGLMYLASLDGPGPEVRAVPTDKLTGRLLCTLGFSF
jgi:hypothetical protein